MKKRAYAAIAAVAFLFSPSFAFAAVSFQGFAAKDFPAPTCINDSGGQDVGLPNLFGGVSISGFDIQSVCLSYDPSLDTLYVGLKTFTDSQGFSIIFGDADGDGDPGRTGTTLQKVLGLDLADLGGSEFLTLAIDFDRNGLADLVVGVTTEKDLQGLRVATGTSQSLLLAPFEIFYGTPPEKMESKVFASPHAGAPDFEFSIVGLTQGPKFSSLNLKDPDSFFQLYITTGSFADDGISEEYFPNVASWLKLTSEELKDNDLDQISDARDSDDDNDSLLDLVEKNLAKWDVDGDSVLSLGEVLGSNLDKDGDGDIDIKDLGKYPDTDGDGIFDYLDTDSDNDKIVDLIEKTADSDQDGIPNFRDLDSDGDGLSDDEEDANDDGKVGTKETSPTSIDTDGDGLCDGELVIGNCTGSEIKQKTLGWTRDSDDDGLCDGSLVVAPCKGSESLVGTAIFESTTLPLGGDVDLSQGEVRLQGSGLSCSFIPAPHFTKENFILCGLLFFSFFFFWRFFPGSKVRPH